jgi:RimJ/RimL family protein N-acetyltransferase
MKDSLRYHGERVRLVAPEPEKDAHFLARWSRDSAYLRLYDALPAHPRSVSFWREKLQKSIDRSDEISFMILLLEQGDPVGIVTLDGILWSHRTAWLAIGLGERTSWGQGYGTEALELILRYGFSEFNLHRISLSVYEYNRRAIRTYEKLHFVIEGRAREFLERDGRRWDMLFMGLLRREWEQSLERSAAPEDEDRV